MNACAKLIADCCRALNVFSQALFLLFRPVQPGLWLPFARRLANVSGWHPSMFPIAMFGTALGTCWLFIPFLNGPIALGFRIVTWLTWGIVSCIAMAIASASSIANLRRRGFRSFFRSRVWFEIAHVSWHLAFFAVVAIVATSFIESALNLRPVMWIFARQIVLFPLLVFATTGAVGFVIALACWRIPKGRAFECVNFFLPLFGSGWLIVYAMDNWLAAPNFAASLQAALAGVLRATIMASSFVVTCIQFEARQKVAEEIELHKLQSADAAARRSMLLDDGIARD